MLSGNAESSEEAAVTKAIPLQAATTKEPPAAPAGTARGERRQKPEPRWLRALFRLYGHIAMMSVYK